MIYCYTKSHVVRVMFYDIPQALNNVKMLARLLLSPTYRILGNFHFAINFAKMVILIISQMIHVCNIKGVAW